LGRRRFPIFKIVLALLAMAVLAFLARSVWLPAFGYALVHDDGPGKAEIAVVLGGDYYGHRIDKAAELVRDGYVPSALISGPPGFYGLYESDLAIQFAVRKGYPANWFIPLPNSALSTKEEAVVILAELRRRNIRSFLLVTSDFHTGRAGRIYKATERAMGYYPAMRVVAAPDEFFRANSWWRARQSQKTTFNEWTKTVATAFGM
jgi:uncharacterized SAM-binding protein YcdF (DUF218 family)